jgi:hypothetical protein
MKLPLGEYSLPHWTISLVLALLILLPEVRSRTQLVPKWAVSPTKNCQGQLFYFGPALSNNI